jgi:hypothetical protein
MLRKFLSAREGNFAAILAIASVPLMAAVAGVVDFVSVNNKATKLQDALDTAALAVATKYYSGMSATELEEMGREFFDSNVSALYTNPDEFDYVAPEDDFSAKATNAGLDDFITVRSSVAHQGMLGSQTWKTSRESIVRIAPGEPACVLALDPHAYSSVKIQGSTKIDMNGCLIAANSDSSQAIYRGGSAEISAECVTTVGGTSGLEGSSYTHLECPQPLENQYPTRDPLANVKPPVATGCISASQGKTKTLSPGTYCNEMISGEVTLEPGTYILRGGEVKLGGNGFLIGHGVTIFLLEGAEFNINANQIVQLSPPASGDYAGITIYQEKGNTSPLVVNGGVGSEITGFVYAPSAHVFHAGNSTTTTEDKCLRIVGNTIEMTGNSSVSLNCEDELGGRSIMAGRRMTIVR